MYVKKYLCTGVNLLAGFLIWTILLQIIDVQPIGPNGSKVGFATFNVRFHQLCGVHLKLYILTDWLGLIPIGVCMIMGTLGLKQLITRRSLIKVDSDILILGIYYLIVILGYLLFEMIPINYRPILIDGVLEASYPSSTTLLVLSVMPTLILQCRRRLPLRYSRIITVFALAFIFFMVAGRLAAGVHWITDIIGSVFLSLGLYYIYKGIVLYRNGQNCEDRHCNGIS